MGLDTFLIMAAASAVDPIALVVLLLPGLLHRRWWPRLLWAAAWAVLVVLILGADGPLGALRPFTAFTGALVYMSVLFAIRQLFGRRRKASVPA